MRGVVEGLVNPVPLRHRVPGVLQDDELLCRLLEAFDSALAPVIATLDGLAGYVDPWLAPEDFLEWLSGWVGVELDDAWSMPQRREIVAGAALLHRQRGTAAGIQAALRLALGADVTLSDSGGATWSATPGGDLPGDPVPAMTVTIEVEDPGEADGIDVRRIEALLESTKPAHVLHTARVGVRGGAADRPEPGAVAAAPEEPRDESAEEEP